MIHEENDDVQKQTEDNLESDATLNQEGTPKTTHQEEEETLEEEVPSPQEEEVKSELTEASQPELEADKADSTAQSSEETQEITAEEAKPQAELSMAKSEEESPKMEASSEKQPSEAEAEKSDEAEGDSEDESKEEEAQDYSNYSKDEFLDLVKRLDQVEDLQNFTPLLKEVKPMFDEIIQKEKSEAKERFIAEGGEEEGFEYKMDELSQEFYKLYKKLQKRRGEQIAKKSQSREKNYQRKQEILEKIRSITESEESQKSLDEVKALQKEWKEVGPIAPQHNRTLWANYNALLDIFYDQRSIYYELKELDRKKNLALKLALCEKAEKLLDYEIIRDAVKELNDLHEEYKHIGPVPKEEQELLWQRFKAASDKVYEKKREYQRKMDAERLENLEKKEALCKEVLPFAAFQSDKIGEWNAKTKELLALQKKWEEIRFIPREKIKEVSKSFWNPFKTFFNNKNTFLRTLDAEREGNLKEKEALCEQVEQITQSELSDGEIAAELKRLQQKWKDIGPVPAKNRKSIFERFKKTCDAFFEKRRKAHQEREKGFEENLKLKEELCAKVANTPQEIDNPAQLVKDYIKEWKSIGFVPRKDKNKIQNKFDEAIDALINRIPKTSEVEKEKIRLKSQASLIQDSPNAKRKMQQHEGGIRRKINELENNISTLNNNIGFLANSKNADKLKESFNKQIEDSNKELSKLRNQLKAIRDMKG